MTAFEKVPHLALPTATVEFDGHETLCMAGTLAMRDPSVDLGGFLRAVHSAATEHRLSSVRVDVSKLTFVNSSSIRLFIDWATWVREADEQRRYKLVFVTDRHITWQRTAFAAIRSLASPVVDVETVN
jgi:hypothetical protein